MNLIWAVVTRVFGPFIRRKGRVEDSCVISFLEPGTVLPYSMNTYLTWEKFGKPKIILRGNLNLKRTILSSKLSAIYLVYGKYKQIYDMIRLFNFTLT